MVTLKKSENELSYVNDVFSRSEHPFDLVNPINYSAAVVDAVATVPNILLPDSLSYDSVIPEALGGYHRRKGAFDAVAGVATVFAGVGLGTKAAKLGGFMDRAAESAGASTRLRATMFADTASVGQYDNMMATAMGARANAIAATGRTTPNIALSGRLGDGAKELRSLTGADTYEGAAQWASRLNTRNGLKEGLWQEAAIFALGSQNEFLFPEDASFTGMLMLGAGGVGVNAGVNHMMRRTAQRKTLARIGRQAGSTAERARQQQGLMTEGAALGGTVGEQWQNMAASLYGLRAIDELETYVDGIVSAGGGALSREAVLNELGVMRSAYRQSLQDSAQSTGKSKINNKITRTGYGTTPAVSEEVASKATAIALANRIEQNEQLVGALADTGSAGYAAKWERLSTTIDADVDAGRAAVKQAQEAGDVDALRAAQSQLDEARTARRTLDATSPATIEPYAVANSNPWRAAPYWETGRASERLATDGGLARLENSPIAMNTQGKLVRFETGKAASPVEMNDLDFDEVTALYTTFGRMADSATETGIDNRFTRDLLQDYLMNPSAKWEDMPFPMQDALANGLLKIPQDLANLPRMQELDRAIDSGMVGNAALANKLDWWRQNRANVKMGNPELDLMDAEKALNLRLTDKAGNPNVLGRAVQAFADEGGEVSAKSFLLNEDVVRSGNANQGLDRLFDLGYGASEASHLGLREALEPDFQAGLKGIGAFEGHKVQNQPIGALYHKVDVPTDGELNLAKLAALRNHDRLEQLTDGGSELVSAISRALLEDQGTIERAGAVSSLFDDVFVRGNTLQQTTNQHRLQSALQAAAMVEKMARAAHDAQVKEVLEPLAKMVRDAMKTPQWTQMAPQLSNAQQLVSRGVALADDSYVAGVNKLDMSRPGAQKLLEVLQPNGKKLEGAPDKLEDWLMFDVSIAANQGRYVPVQLSDESARLLNEYAGASGYVYDAINSLRKSAGQPPMERLRGHMPTMNFARYKLRYIEDEQTGKVVGYVKGKTDREADDALTQAIAEEQTRRSGAGSGGSVRAISLDEIKEYYDAVDEVFLHNLRDFSGVKQSGTSSGRNLDFRLDASTDLAEDMMIALRNSFDDVRRRTIAGVMAPQLNELRTAMRKAGPQGSGKAEKGYFNAIEQYQNVLLGDSRLPEGSNAKAVHATATQLANWAMGRVADAAPYVWRAAMNYENGFATPAEAKYAKKVLDDYKPFHGLVENPELARYLKVGTDVDPYRAERALQMANRGVASALLKIANVAHPILNYAGIAVTAPAVLRAMQKMPNESVEDWKIRAGPLADMLNDADGVATMSPHKLLIEGFEQMMKRPDVLEEAARRGMIEANMLEELNRLNNLRPSKFVDAMEGAAKYGDFINIWLTPAQRKLTGKEPSAYTISERSETGSRAWVHMMGYTIAERGGVVGEAAKHNFAHYFANQNIADYSPNLRGQAFRGMAGIPFGLFQSYAINLYQRLFNYVGDGNKRALATQAATQAGVFGVSGLPGWDVLNSYYFPQKDIDAGEKGATLNERIYNGFGKETADLLMTGSLSNLPKVINMLPGEQGMGAINLFTSGDMNLRAGVVPPAPSVIGQTATMFGKLAKTSYEEVGKIGGPEQFDGDRIMEVIANYAPMRGYRSMADLLIGERVDRNGNLILEDTRSGTALLARALGTKGVDEMQTAQAIYQNGRAMAQRQQDMNRLRSQMLRTIREGDMSEDEMASYMTSYLAQGGRADQWDRWVNYTAEKAGMTREDRMLERIVGKAGEIWPHQLTAAKRLQAAGVEPTEEMLSRQAEAATEQ